MKRLGSAALLGLSLSVLTGCGAASSGDDVGVVQGAQSGTSGDWSQLGGGQCLASMQSFYVARFGVRLPTARDAYTGSCAEEGACHLWYDDIPSPSLWERIPNDGRSTPATYDLAVFGETSRNPYGHVASVDHVENGTLFVMDSNYNGDERASQYPHAVRPPLGWYHLRAGGGGNGGGETCGELASRRGWAAPACEQASSSNAYSRVACNGTGSATADCSRCCDSWSVGAGHTDESCGAYANRVGFAAPRCESATNGACGGSGPSTGDGCLHCCETP